MTSCQKALRPMQSCLRQTGSSSSNTFVRKSRAFVTSCRLGDVATESIISEPSVVEVTTPTAYKFDAKRPTWKIDPQTVTSPRAEAALMRRGQFPVGSRRRRAAIQSSDNIPFTQLPYQCFQDALRFLAEDRAEKINAIKNTRAKISALEVRDAATIKGGERMKNTRLKHLKEHIEQLKIEADINDPLIKKRFEDGLGDMSKPIYRHLAEKKWRSYQKLIIVQRINQMSVVPDVLRIFEPTAEVRMAFRSRAVQPGEFIDSRVSEVPARLNIQLFDKGNRLLTIAMIDPDVPDLKSDNFTARCHFLAVNVPFGPTDSSLPLSKIATEHIVHPWLSPFAQKGSPYHRMSVFVIEQEAGQTLDATQIHEQFQRDSFSLQNFVLRQKIKPIGVNLFRSTWDEGTAGVMARANIPGADVEFQKKKVIAIKPKQKARGWEARHSGPKYAALKVGRNVGKQYK